MTFLRSPEPCKQTCASFPPYFFTYKRILCVISCYTSVSTWIALLASLSVYLCVWVSVCVCAVVWVEAVSSLCYCLRWEVYVKVYWRGVDSLFKWAFSTLYHSNFVSTAWQCVRFEGSCPRISACPLKCVYIVLNHHIGWSNPCFNCR